VWRGPLLPDSSTPERGREWCRDRTRAGGRGRIPGARTPGRPWSGVSG